jgi:thiamine kinase-like enzyme
MTDTLTGGRSTIKRSDQTVIRPAGPWTPTVHALLLHLRKNGFIQAPQPFELRDDGTEVVSYLEGDVSNYPLSPAARSETALHSAARMLRAYHDATKGFDGLTREDARWMLPASLPAEVICHGDFAPYNVVLQGETAVGLIDFDCAHPGPRVWDIAYALYRWSAFHHPETDGVFNMIGDQIERAGQFCLSYGTDVLQDASFAGLMLDRLDAMMAFMQAQADAGNVTFQANIREGHLSVYQRDQSHIRTHAKQIDTALSAILSGSNHP